MESELSGVKGEEKAVVAEKQSEGSRPAHSCTAASGGGNPTAAAITFNGVIISESQRTSYGNVLLCPCSLPKVSPLR